MFFLIVLVLTICGGNSLVIAQSPSWIAPSYSNSLKNLFGGNPAVTAEGRIIYN